MSERVRIADLFRNARLTLSNGLRLLRRKGVDYVVLPVQGSYPERVPERERPFPLSLLPWPSPPPTVESFNDALERIATDRRVKGVILVINNLPAQPATLTSLRQAVLRLRDADKEAVAYLAESGMWPYYLAAACDRIFVPESGGLQTAGLWSEPVFLKDTLALVGIEADLESIAEYKVSPDSFRRSEMTEPHREMLESLLDAIYDKVVGGIAEGRRLEPDRVRELLDRVPLQPAEAEEAGLFDGICYEDELPGRLGSPERPAALITWEAAQKRLVRPRRWRSRRSIGVISLEGLIVPGPSRRPPMPVPLPLPVPGKQAGADTLTAQLRAAARSRKLAAVILHVDSPGGSSLASDLIWREVDRLRQEKPVVVYMNNQAASGGYYVSAPASAIVAQPTTLTGSIGIWGGKIVTQGLYDKVGANREVVARGKAAGLYADTAPFTEEQRARIRSELGAGYALFKARVAAGRGMTDEEVEAIARGRVWTGEQALKRGLVDALGDLQQAADQARELAGVPANRYAPLINLSVPKQHQLPQASAGAAGEWLAGLQALLREGILALAPWSIRIRD
jgi:protease IV